MKCQVVIQNKSRRFQVIEYDCPAKDMRREGGMAIAQQRGARHVSSVCIDVDVVIPQGPTGGAPSAALGALLARAA